MSQATFTLRNLGIIFAALTSADAVAGNLIISKNTTWHAGEVHDLNYTNVQIANGVTLTIEGGVEITGAYIQVFGTLNAIGTPDALVRFRGATILPANTSCSSVNDGRINIAYADIMEGFIMGFGGGGCGSITLTDSIINKLNSPGIQTPTEMTLSYPVADSHIERNIFYQSGGISVGTSDNVSIYIKNNVFAEQRGLNTIINWANYSGATVVENNSFLSKDLVALSGSISASNNYFGTTDTALINAMIYDKNDDYAATSIISTSHTNAPSSDTPRFFVGADGNDILAGGGTENGLLIGKLGTDIVIYSHASDQYKISLSSPYSIFTDTGTKTVIHTMVSDIIGRAGVDVLEGVERLQFPDKSIALDIDGNAGKVAKILGVVFGKEAVSNAEYAGIGLQLLDDGMSYEDLMMLALNAKLGAGFSIADEVRLLYQNLAGSQPSQADLDYWVGTITSGQYTQASFGLMVAEMELNAANIDLAGLAKTGLSFISTSNKTDTIIGTTGPNILVGGTGNDIIDGLAGIDTVAYSDEYAHYVISFDNPDVTVNDSTGNTGIDVLTGVERLRFSDKSIALDIDGNAGKVAKILGAVFGKKAVSNAEYAGIGLRLLDDGMSYEDLMMLALNAKLGVGFSDADEVRLLYQNLVGSQPSQADLDYWTRAIASGQYTQATLGVMAADLELNISNINLAGLANTGLAYHN